MISLLFLLNSAALGVGLAMDAFSVSLANGLHEPRMPQGRMSFIAGVYAFFQFLMPMIGWACVHTILLLFSAFRKLIPWIALGLLLYLGGKMILEGIRERGQSGESEDRPILSGNDLLLQGIATSIDALSVGFAIAEYHLLEAFLASLIIAAVTFIICIGGLMIGKRAGTALSWKASVLGGCILVFIGLEIFLKNM
ncbi:MAG: manganese efflux pump [Stomatobaculum sp.]|nr:manganese efflux pump [Stomatobaculum sp.]